MAQTDRTHALADVPLDIERLDVYRVAVEFHGFVTAVLKARRIGGLREQLERASTSIVLNIAEGAGRRTSADKGGFYVIARGSAMECGDPGPPRCAGDPIDRGTPSRPREGRPHRPDADLPRGPLRPAVVVVIVRHDRTTFT